MNKIKKPGYCPFCGSKKIESRVSKCESPGWEETWEPLITCGDCGIGFISGNFLPGFSQEQAEEINIERWNRRYAEKFIRDLESVLVNINEYWNRDENFNAMANACYHNIDAASEAIHRIKLFLGDIVDD